MRNRPAAEVGVFGSDQERLEEMAAAFTLVAADALPGDLRTLAFVSPACVRVPDDLDMWQPAFRRRPALLAASMSAALVPAVLAGCVRAFARRGSAFGGRLFGESGSRMLVLVEGLGAVGEDGVFRTPYVSTSPSDFILLFSRSPDGPTPVERLRPLEALAAAARLLRAGWSAGRSVSGPRTYRCLLLLAWTRWTLALTWRRELLLERAVCRILQERQVTAVGCVHEMNAYARTVWRACREAGVRTYAVQHAEVTEGKRWYFPRAEELADGVAVPDVLHVFSEDVADLLRTSLPQTSFPLGCSSRYARWKDATPTLAPRHGWILFAGALAAFDNDTLFAVLRRLAGAMHSRRIRLRLHPDAVVREADRRWLIAAEREGRLDVARGSSLVEDIEGASLVVGFLTTVLEEALMMGRPVVRLDRPGCFPYVAVDGVEGAATLSWDRVTAEDLLGMVGRRTDAAAMRLRLGIDLPEVTFERLFEDSGSA